MLRQVKAKKGSVSYGRMAFVAGVVWEILVGEKMNEVDLLEVVE